ncbi:MAG: DUF4870 domain-containing protein, partial [Anaerolineae bacterium]|nr:DUF4870 domain-containing protein [Anaerolineae bacterium]
ENHNTTEEEKLLMALSHAGVLLPIYGIVAPILIWVTQRNKSRKVTFHAVQATVYQGLPLIVTLLFFGCYMIIFPLGILISIPIAEGGGSDAAVGALITILSTCPFAFLMLIYVFFIIYGLVGALRVFQDKTFDYWLIGPWLRRYLDSSSAVDQTHAPD